MTVNIVTRQVKRFPLQVVLTTHLHHPIHKYRPHRPSHITLLPRQIMRIRQVVPFTVAKVPYCIRIKHIIIIIIIIIRLFLESCHWKTIVDLNLLILASQLIYLSLAISSNIFTYIILADITFRQQVDIRRNAPIHTLAENIAAGDQRDFSLFHQVQLLGRKRTHVLKTLLQLLNIHRLDFGSVSG
jgi:hypothetical protein